MKTWKSSLLERVPSLYPCRTLRTSVTTSYVDYDDAWYASLGLGVAKAYRILSVEAQYTGTTAIVVNGKTDNHSNICVLDLKTGLMWSQTVSASVGPGSNGLLPWTTTGSGATAEGIFPYVLAANVAGLAGFTDWRIANMNELLPLIVYGDTVRDAEGPDLTAFPTWPDGSGVAYGIVWSSTPTAVDPTVDGLGMKGAIYHSGVGGYAYTNAYFCALVRGGN